MFSDIQRVERDILCHSIDTEKDTDGCILAIKGAPMIELVRTISQSRQSSVMFIKELFEIIKYIWNTYSLNNKLC